MARWGLVLGFALGAVALAAGGAALSWLDGPALWAGMVVFALLSWAAILSVRDFERAPTRLRR